LSLLTPKQNEKHRKSEPAQIPTLATPENQRIKLKQPSSAGHTPMRMFSKSGVMCQDIKVGTGTQAKQGKMVNNHN
jgi:FKBP-type peptidyl-prolyl cis-trans isomerase